MRLSRLLSLATVATSISLSSATNFFQVVGNKIYNTNNESVIFKGIGFTCTEYMQRTIFGPDFWWESCFVGPPPPHYNTTMVLTNETQFVLNYLLPDTLGGNFPTSLPIQKVTFDAPFNEVIDMSSPKHHPIVRIPVTASSYLYDEDANHLGSAGYRQAIDMLVQFYTSNGVAVIIDHHSSCEGTLPCPRGGPMAIRNMGNYSGSLAFWDLVAYTYGNNPLVLYELYNEPHVWYQAYYGGDPLYAGMAEMLDVIRKHTQGLVIVGAASQYSQDANSGLAFYLQYVREHNNTPPSNVIYNLHPYQGVSMILCYISINGLYDMFEFLFNSFFCLFVFTFVIIHYFFNLYSHLISSYHYYYSFFFSIYILTLFYLLLSIGLSRIRTFFTSNYAFNLSIKNDWSRYLYGIWSILL